MNRLILPFLLCVAACSPAAEQPAANQAEASAAQEEAAPVPALAGNWNVTAINGKPLTQIFTMTAAVTGDRLTINSDCVAMTWSYRQDRNLVTFTKVSTRECPRGRTLNEDQAEKALGMANIAIFSDEGREVQLSGAGGTVTMTRR